MSYKYTYLGSFSPSPQVTLRAIEYSTVGQLSLDSSSVMFSSDSLNIYSGVDQSAEELQLSVSELTVEMKNLLTANSLRTTRVNTNSVSLVFAFFVKVFLFMVYVVDYIGEECECTQSREPAACDRCYGSDRGRETDWCWCQWWCHHLICELMPSDIQVNRLRDKSCPF